MAPPFGGRNFQQNKLGDIMMKSPSMLYYVLTNPYQTNHSGSSRRLLSLTNFHPAILYSSPPI